jgi:hypothetical protein
MLVQVTVADRKSAAYAQQEFEFTDFANLKQLVQKERLRSHLRRFHFDSWPH